MRKTAHTVALLLALAMTMLPLAACGGPESTSEPPYPTPQPNSQRTGVYDTKGPRSTPSEAWKLKAEDEIESSPTVVGGTVYFGSNDKHLYAVDASNGQLRWKLKTGDRVRSSPVVHEGVVYVGSDDGALYAADASAGAEKWKAKTYGYFILLDQQGACCEEYLNSNLPSPGSSYAFLTVYSASSDWGISASPVITGGQAYFGAEGAYFYATDLAAGEILWVATTTSEVTSTAAADGNSIYAISSKGSVFSLDAKTGRENWRLYTLDDFRRSSVVVASGTIYAGGASGKLWAVDASNGQEKWHFQGAGWSSAPIVSGNSVYFTADEHLYALDAQTGAKLWEFTRAGVRLAPPSLADGLLYLGSGQGYLYAVDAGTGQELWKYDAGSEITRAPAIADGMIYFGREDGYLYALR